MPKNHRVKYIKDNFFKIFVTLIVLTLIISQGTFFLKRVGVREASVAPEIAPVSVTLSVFRGEHSGVKVLVNGEEAGEFNQSTLTLSFDEDSVIEIYNPRDKIAAVQVIPGYGTEFVSGSQKKLCQKGLTYIGKVKICRQ